MNSKEGCLTMGIRENKAKNLPFGDRFVFWEEETVFVKQQMHVLAYHPVDVFSM